MNLYFFQCQESYGNNVYLPYSSGILWSYVNQFDMIKNNFTLGDIFFEKIPVQDYIERVKDPDILLFSNYGWNTNYHLSIAKQFKTQYPNLIIIIGGPNAQQDEPYLQKHDYIDYSVWGEGEQTLLELLTSLHEKTNLECVPGISYIKNKKYVKTEVRTRQKTLEEIPSPYLEGIFDSYFIRYPNLNFMPIWETHRGCPYHCTFCDLGADYYNKVYTFTDERLYKEIDWFSDHKIEYVEVADANFGIFPRDLELVKYIKQKHVTTGFPEKISATWAKNSPERILEMSTILDSIGRGGVTLALQSQNTTALNNIKRINITNERLEEITKKYIKLNIPTYHDFILGLPGETLESWKDGISYVIDINPEGWIFGHPLEAYENTEFSDPEYISKHNLKFAITPQVSFFAHRRKDVPLEYGKYVISNNSMSSNDYLESFLFKWFMITMHSFGWFNEGSRLLADAMGEKQSSIYKKFLNFCIREKNIVYEEYEMTKMSLKNTIENKSFWGRQVFGDDDIYWEYESASAIAFEKNRKKFFDSLKNFVSETYGEKYIEVIKRTDHSLISFNKVYPYRIDQYNVVADNYKDFETFCKEIYHRGRRTKKWKTKLTVIPNGGH